MDSKGIENFLLSATSNGGQGLGEGLAAIFGGMKGGLPPGIDPKEMEFMWKQLDDMAQKDPDQYKKFIDKQMAEMKQEAQKEKKEEEKAQTIQSEAAFAIRALIAKKVEGGKKKDVNDTGIKLFDFSDSQIKESFIDNDEKADPLEKGPKLYLNVVFHDFVLPPLDQGRDIADPKNDRSWNIIPMVFTEPKTRQNIEGKTIITWDCHINAAVIAKMREDKRAMRSISNYIIVKFQEHVEHEYVIHKKSIKFLNKKKYKCGKGTNQSTVAAFVLPKEHDVRSFKQVRERLRKEHEEQQKKAMGTAGKVEVKLPTAKASETKKQEEVKGIDIKIPGQPVKQEAPKKPIVIQEMGKTIPNYEMTQSEDGATVTMTFNVEEESSAKDIDLDFSDTTVILNSKNYEFTYNFQSKNGYLVDPGSVKAKFNKAKKTLSLTFTKVM